MTTSTGLEGWVLMALICKDIDDFDYKNALVLSERLYAMDKDNQDFRLLYAKCLYLLGDYNGTFAVLKDNSNNSNISNNSNAVKSIPCRHLFARSCLELGNLADKTEKSSFYWRSGVQALDLALKDYAKETTHNWANDLTCVALRSHMPSQASVRNLMGELYIKLENIRGAAIHLWQCLAHNPFKLTAFTKICDISPDVSNLDNAISPNDIFKDFDLKTTHLDRFSGAALPSLPSTSLSKPSLPRQSKHTALSSPVSTVRNISAASHFASNIASAFSSTPASPNDSSFAAPSVTQNYAPPRLEPYMPKLRSNHADITLEQLQALVQLSFQTHPEMPTWEDEPEKGDIENQKDKVLQAMTDDIEKQKVEETMKNKHGLHKKPPTETANDLTVASGDSGDEYMDASVGPVDLFSFPPPRLLRDAATTTHQTKGSTPDLKHRLRNVKRSDGHSDEPSPSPKRRSTLLKSMDNNNSVQPGNATLIDSYFVPWISASSPATLSHKPSLGNTTTGTTTSALKSKASKEVIDQIIIDAMNKIIRILRIFGMGYFYQSSYYCRETALELQKLDQAQYDTAPVLCLLGQAYYDAGDHQMARVFYRRSFALAPWYCVGVPIYSTCLWYLEKEQELGLLAKVMKDNYSHRYEACIAAGNWTKCSNRGNESIRWFQKAVDLDPGRSYGHALLGYEEWEKDNCLGAKQHFSQCIITDKRSYFGWYGAATAYQGMHEFTQAKELMKEALRLHPRHPVLLGTMAEILFSLKAYDSAYMYIEESLATRNNISMEELKNKIKQKLDTQHEDGDDDDDVVAVGGLSL